MSQTHLRCQVKYQKGRENFRKSVVSLIDQIKDLEGIESYYFFWQEYSEKFERHIQFDLLVKDSKPSEELKSQVEDVLNNLDREFYWEDEFIGPWWGMNEREKELLIEARSKNAELAYKTLKSDQENRLEHRPEEFINRNYHLAANQMGMTYKEELKFCLKRPIQMLSVKLLPEKIYNFLFLRRELENIDQS